MSQEPENREVYEGWVRSYAGEMYRFAYRLTGRVQAAEDLVQETFVEAWRSIGSLRAPEKARSWLFQILRHRYAHARRTEGRRMEGQPGKVAVTDLIAAKDRGGVLHVLAEKDSIQSGLDKIDARLREAFLSVFMEGQTCQEAATKLNVPVGTVLSRLHRARQQLRAVLRVADDGGAVPTEGMR